MRGKRWTRQTLSETCDATNWDDLLVSPWQTVALEVRWTEQLPQTMKDWDFQCKELCKEFQKLNRGDSTYYLLTLKFMVQMEVVRVVPRWHRMEE